MHASLLATTPTVDCNRLPSTAPLQHKDLSTLRPNSMNISGFSRKYNFRITIYKYLIFLLLFFYMYINYLSTKEPPECLQVRVHWPCLAVCLSYGGSSARRPCCCSWDRTSAFSFFSAAFSFFSTSTSCLSNSKSMSRRCTSLSRSISCSFCSLSSDM